jgi:hypothetical protein
MLAVRMGGAITEIVNRAMSWLDHERAGVHQIAMSDDAQDSLIPYDEIVQEALRAVVGRVLSEVGDADDLPGEHHFYITFKTRVSGVEIPDHLLERFPDEMTVVLQKRFRDLQVTDEGFSVGLSFNGVPTQLAVPFAAITGFVDPAVNFALQFQALVDGAEPETADHAENDSPPIEPVEDGSNVVAVDFKRKK